jgi:predicted nucleic acid-binding protein
LTPAVALLDVNALVALAWDSHLHHVRIREWFAANAARGWATCPTNAHLLTLARRRGMRLVTFDTAIDTLAQGRDVEVLGAF